MNRPKTLEAAGELFQQIGYCYGIGPEYSHFPAFHAKKDEWKNGWKQIGFLDWLRVYYSELIP